MTVQRSPNSDEFGNDESFTALRWYASLVLVLASFVLPGCSSSKRTTSSAPAKTQQPQSGGEVILIPAGSFTMGDSQGSPEERPHEVSLDSFYMDRYPVSQELYEKVMGVNPSKRKSPKNPVERVQWTDAARFCNKCSQLDGLTPCYDLTTWQCDFSANGYRLPTEAEWEYACRAGKQTKYFFGNDASELPKYAWCKPHSKGRTRPVGQKRPSPWGLYDMHGNVWEWCNDYYSKSYYTQSPAKNPRGPTSGKKRVLRGGAWNSTAVACRAAHRFSEFQVFSDACFGADSYGFRRVRIWQPQGARQKQVAKAATTNTKKTSNKQNKDQKKPKSTKKAKPQPRKKGTSAIKLTGKIDIKRLKGSIVFVSDRGGEMDIWRMKANGKNLRQLTNDKHRDADPRFSPSGKQIMYTTLREGFPQIWMMNSDGSKPKRIIDGSQAAWSPDEKSIIFIRDDQAFVRALASGKEQRLTPKQWRRCGVPAWRPDGKQVAVASRHLGRIGVFLMTVDGKKAQQLKTEDACCSPNWSADSRRLAFQTDKGHIHLFDSEDGTEEQVTFGGDIQHDARFSPDGTLIVYCRASSLDGPWQLWLTDLESEDLDSMQVTKLGSNRLPDWHPTEVKP